MDASWAAKIYKGMTGSHSDEGTELTKLDWFSAWFNYEGTQATFSEAWGFFFMSLFIPMIVEQNYSKEGHPACKTEGMKLDATYGNAMLEGTIGLTVLIAMHLSGKLIRSCRSSGYASATSNVDLGNSQERNAPGPSQTDTLNQNNGCSAIDDEKRSLISNRNVMPYGVDNKHNQSSLQNSERNEDGSGNGIELGARWKNSCEQRKSTGRPRSHSWTTTSQAVITLSENPIEEEHAERQQKRPDAEQRKLADVMWRKIVKENISSIGDKCSSFSPDSEDNYLSRSPRGPFIREDSTPLFISWDSESSSESQIPLVERLGIAIGSAIKTPAGILLNGSFSGAWLSLATAAWAVEATSSPINGTSPAKLVVSESGQCNMKNIEVGSWLQLFATGLFLVQGGLTIGGVVARTRDNCKMKSYKQVWQPAQPLLL